METRMHPRGDGSQRCLTFHLAVSPRCRAFSIATSRQTQVHHFIPATLAIGRDCRGLVDLQHPAEIPPSLTHKLGTNGRAGPKRRFWEMLLPASSRLYAVAADLAKKLDVRRRDDPFNCFVNSELSSVRVVRLRTGRAQGGFSD